MFYLGLGSWILGPARVNILLILDDSIAFRQAWDFGFGIWDLGFRTCLVNILLIYDDSVAFRQAWQLGFGIWDFKPAW